MADVDPLLRERVLQISRMLIDALSELDDPPQLSSDATVVIAEHICTALVAGANQGGREIMAALQRQFDEAGYDVLVALPPQLLAENDILNE